MILEKEEILVSRSIFFFTHNVFESFLSQGSLPRMFFSLSKLEITILDSNNLYCANQMLQVISIPNDKILDVTCADIKLNVAKMISFLSRVENIVGKRENGDQHFLLFSLCFSKPSFFMGR